jgi:hypothetical protein
MEGARSRLSFGKYRDVHTENFETASLARS